MRIESSLNGHSAGLPNIPNKKNMRISRISAFVKDHKILSISCIAAAIAAVVHVFSQRSSDLSKANQNSFSFVGSLCSTVSSFMDEIKAKGGLNDQELLKKYQEIRDNYEKNKQKITEERKRKFQEATEETSRRIQDEREEAFNFEERWKSQKELDDHEAEEEGIRAGEELIQRYLGVGPAPSVIIEQNCDEINFDDFKDMTDLDRLTDQRLNPLCCKHAKMMFTRSTDLALFSLIDKVSSQWKQLAQTMHPDIRLGLFEKVNKAMSRLNEAHSVLCLEQCWQ